MGETLPCQPVQGSELLAETGPGPVFGPKAHEHQVSSPFSGTMRSKQTTPPPLSMDTSLTP